MLEAIKFLLPLLLVSAVIITLDQYNKKGRYRKIWAGTTITCCFIFLLTYIAGPPQISSSGKPKPPDSITSSSQAARAKEPAAKTGSDNSSGPKTDNSSENSPGSSSGQEQTQQSPQNNDSRISQQPGGLPQDLLLPVDEAALDADFKNFRDDFAAAVKSQDLAFLKSHLSPDLRYSFGENSGVTGFLHQWQLDAKPDESMIWSELAEVLNLGGSFDQKKTVFTAPYVFANFPPTVDGFQNVAVTAQNVSVHAEPNSDSPIIIGLSYKILKLADTQVYKATGKPQSGESTEWRKVETSAGTGFINEAYVRSPIDYRAQFRMENGEWKMMFFVAGD